MSRDKTRAALDAQHDRFEGALAEALGQPPMSIFEGDGPTAPDLESLIAMVADLRRERDELRATVAAVQVQPEGAGDVGGQ